MSLANNLLSPNRNGKRLFSSVVESAVKLPENTRAQGIFAQSSYKKPRISDHLPFKDPRCSTTLANEATENSASSFNLDAPSTTNQPSSAHTPINKPVLINAASQTDLSMCNSIITPIPDTSPVRNLLVSALISPQKPPLANRPAPRLLRTQSSVTINNVKNVSVSRKLTSFSSMQSMDLPQPMTSNTIAQPTAKQYKKLEHTRTSALEVDEPETSSNSTAPINEKPSKKKLAFGNVDVYCFKSSHSYDTIPTEGGIPLGMEYKHCDVKHYQLDEYDKEHRLNELLKDYVISDTSSTSETRRKRFKHDTAGSTSKLHAKSLEERPGPSTRRAVQSKAASSLDDVEDNSYRQPEALDKKARLQVLKKNGIPIDEQLNRDCALITRSRKQCGCSCEKGVCLPETCQCALDGITCHVDQDSYPCNCSKTSCGNQAGRFEFDPDNVKNHFERTMRRLRAEARREKPTAKPLPRSVSSNLITQPFIIPIVQFDLEKRPLSNSFEKLVLNTPPPPAKSRTRSKITTQFSSSVNSASASPIPNDMLQNVTNGRDRRKKRHIETSSQEESGTDESSVIVLDSTHDQTVMEIDDGARNLPKPDTTIDLSSTLSDSTPEILINDAQTSAPEVFTPTNNSEVQLQQQNSSEIVVLLGEKTGCHPQGSLLCASRSLSNQTTTTDETISRTNSTETVPVAEEVVIRAD